MGEAKRGWGGGEVGEELLWCVRTYIAATTSVG